MTNYKIEQLKDEIASKQRELVALMETKEEYHFEEDKLYTWVDVGNIIKEMGKTYDLTCKVINKNSSIYINLCVSNPHLLGKRLLKK